MLPHNPVSLLHWFEYVRSRPLALPPLGKCPQTSLWAPSYCSPSSLAPIWCTRIRLWLIRGRKLTVFFSIMIIQLYPDICGNNWSRCQWVCKYVQEQCFYHRAQHRNPTNYWNVLHFNYSATIAQVEKCHDGNICRLCRMWHCGLSV